MTIYLYNAHMMFIMMDKAVIEGHNVWMLETRQNADENI